ncbi:MAG: hypothetical protein EB072_13405 [Betaproteobacteria bacterium]|nr:hypothetical protein [Betaproteobacteria bacterium]
MFEREDKPRSTEWQILLEGLEQRNNKGNRVSVDIDVLERESMRDLKAWIDACLETYFRQVMGAKQDAKIHITQSWSNYSAPGQWHHSHRHQNSWISGVYYVQCNPSDKIQFARDHYDQIRLIPEHWNIYNSPTWWIPVSAGLLLLFPSNLIHEVPQVEGDKVRISIAFNTWPSGTLGDSDQKTALQLIEPIVKAL